MKAFWFQSKLIVERDSANAAMWVARPWRFQFHFDEIKELSSHLDVVLCHKVSSANSMADVLAK